MSGPQPFLHLYRAVWPIHRAHLKIQLPTLQRVLPLTNSRTLCGWSTLCLDRDHNDKLRCHGVASKSFSISAARPKWLEKRSKPIQRSTNHEDGVKVISSAEDFVCTLIQIQEVSDAHSPPQTNTTTTRIRKTLKTKLPALRREDIYNVPNILTVSRLIATPAIGWLIIHNQHLYAFSLFIYAGFTDLLDGWIARKWKLQTVVGSVIDPGADKALMITLVSCLAANGLLPLSVATLILGRDVSLLIAAIYYRYASLPPPKTFTRYWDFSLPSAEVHPTNISKFNTFLQLGLIGTTMCVSLLHDQSAMSSVAGEYLQSIQVSLGGNEGVRTLMRGMSAIVATTTIYSGLSYAFLKNAVTILGENEQLKKKQGFRGRMIIGVTFGAAIALAASFAYSDWRGLSEDVGEQAGHEKSLGGGRHGVEDV